MMKGGLFRRYIAIDMKRAFCSWKIIVSILGICLVMGIASLETRIWQLSVLNSYYYVIYSMPFLLTLIFTTFAFGNCFCEDIEHSYIRFQVIRGNLQLYVISKVIVISLSAVFTMMMGMLLFVLVLRMNFPWIDLAEGTFETLAEYGSFRLFLENGNYIVYFIFCGIQYGLLAAVLAVAAALFSLLYHDALFVLSVPLIVRYLIQYYSDLLPGYDQLNPNAIYDISYNVWDHDWLSFTYAGGVSVLAIVLLGMAIYQMIKRQVI